MSSNQEPFMSLVFHYCVYHKCLGSIYYCLWTTTKGRGLPPSACDGATMLERTNSVKQFVTRVTSLKDILYTHTCVRVPSTMVMTKVSLARLFWLWSWCLSYVYHTCTPRHSLNHSYTIVCGPKGFPTPSTPCGSCGSCGLAGSCKFHKCSSWAWT